MTIMLRSRDLVVCAVSSCATLLFAVGLRSQEQVMSSRIVDWGEIPPRTTNVGQVRDFFRSRTATLEELELHVTTLNARQTSHAPHTHENEEVVIVKEGRLEVFANGETRTVGPGAVVFMASNQPHGVRNAGDGPVTYHVINWRSPGPVAAE
jgi:XRE family transcriptional regulator, regulator of sulfur utilization